PAIGNDEAAGATVKVTAIDDRRVSSLELSVVSFEPLGQPRTPVTVSLSAISSTSVSPTVGERTFRLISTELSRVTLRARAADSEGNLAEADYNVIFGGTLPVPPKDDFWL